MSDFSEEALPERDPAFQLDSYGMSDDTGGEAHLTPHELWLDLLARSWRRQGMSGIEIMRRLSK